MLGVGGGIAAFKAPAVLRELGRRGARVRVAMTRAAQRFVGPATFMGLTGEPPLLDLWQGPGEPHVQWGAWADAILVAPATADLLARAAAGMADDPVLATVACARGTVLWAPGMHGRMWRRASVRRAVERLRADGDRFVGPERGPLANGEVDEGRMSEPEALVESLAQLFVEPDLKGLHVVVSAGPTVEDLDPVRFLSNRSSGRMGYALARRAVERGARVTLVSGPTTLRAPPGVCLRPVRSALQMRAAVREAAAAADAVIMAAAVADYRPERVAPDKIKKEEGALHLRLVRNPDILAELGRARAGASRPVLVGFALESRDAVESARRKLRGKGVDLVVANLAETALGSERSEAWLVTAEGVVPTGLLSKEALADRILDFVRERHATSVPEQR